jgi:hypothetical protein
MPKHYRVKSVKSRASRDGSYRNLKAVLTRTFRDVIAIARYTGAS